MKTTIIGILKINILGLTIMSAAACSLSSEEMIVGKWNCQENQLDGTPGKTDFEMIIQSSKVISIDAHIKAPNTEAKFVAKGSWSIVGDLLETNFTDFSVRSGSYLGARLDRNRLNLMEENMIAHGADSVNIEELTRSTLIYSDEDSYINCQRQS